MSLAPALRQVDLYRRVLAFSTLVMIGISWPLWWGGEAIPRVPFVTGWFPGNEFADKLACVTMAAGFFLTAVGRGIVIHFGLAIALPSMIVLTIGDQHRFQPWAYQAMLTGLAVLAFAPVRAITYCRVFLIALYIHSGLSKLDASFAREQGLTFLTTLLRPFEVDPIAWPPHGRTIAVLAMPALELLVGVGLCFRVTRPWSLWGAVLLHFVLIGILGPWGLDHSGNVLIWNAALILENLILFGRIPQAPEHYVPDSWLARPVQILFAAAVVMPFGERYGYWDTWPSFALYASHTERVAFVVDAADRETLPPSVQPFLRSRSGNIFDEYVLDMTAWSRAVRGTPVYPQARAQLGLAEALAWSMPADRIPRVEVWDRADRWTGRRSRGLLIGRGVIRKFMDERYRKREQWVHLNAHPSPARIPARPLESEDRR